MCDTHVFNKIFLIKIYQISGSAGIVEAFPAHPEAPAQARNGFFRVFWTPQVCHCHNGVLLVPIFIKPKISLFYIPTLNTNIQKYYILMSRANRNFLMLQRSSLLLLLRLFARVFPCLRYKGLDRQ